MIKEQEKKFPQSLDRSPEGTYTDIPSSAESRHLTDCETAGFITLGPKLTEPPTEEDQNVTPPPHHCGCLDSTMIKFHFLHSSHLSVYFKTSVPSKTSVFFIICLLVTHQSTVVGLFLYFHFLIFFPKMTSDKKV